MNYPAEEHADDKLIIEDAGLAGDDKTVQPRTLNEDKLTFISQDKDINTHKLNRGAKPED